MFFSEATSVVGQFDRIAEIHKDNVAIVALGQETTYAELQQSAQELAHCLRWSLSIRAGDRIALYMPAGLELIVSMLAVQYLGCSFFPIYAGVPAKDVDGIIATSSVSACLTLRDADNDEKPQIYDMVSSRIVSIEQQDSTIRQTPLCHHDSDRQDRECYMIRTSGSTGVPKMVSVSNRNLIDRFQSVSDVQTYSSDDTWLLFHSPAFDFSVWEIWGALLYGGTLVIPDEETRKIPWEIVRLIKEQKITVLCQTPSYFNQIQIATRLLGPDYLSGLRYVILGGEAVNNETVGAFLEAHKHLPLRVFNMYGITEVTVHATCKELVLPLSDLGVNNIGKALLGTDIKIVDEAHSEVPVGKTGEIILSGRGVARYCPTTDNKGFGEFGPSGTWTYFSADRGRQLPNGEFEYLGRLNRQVKVAGFRVDLTEIEQSALSLDHVRDARAILAKSPARILLALITDKSKDEFDAGLKEVMPDYIWPSHCTAVEFQKFPINQNGKVDDSEIIHAVRKG
ncbi:MAG: AMP-binding protein [Sulfitobacter sp.]